MCPFAFIIERPSIPDYVIAADMVEGGDVPAVTIGSISHSTRLLNMHMSCINLFLHHG